MNKVINKLEKDLGIPFYYISRDEGICPCIVYNYKKELLITDIRKESAIYDFFFILIIYEKVNEIVEKFEEVLINNLFRNVTINQSSITKDNQSVKTKDGYIQISVTATKNI